MTLIQNTNFLRWGNNRGNEWGGGQNNMMNTNNFQMGMPYNNGGMMNGPPGNQYPMMQPPQQQQQPQGMNQGGWRPNDDFSNNRGMGGRGNMQGGNYYQ